MSFDLYEAINDGHGALSDFKFIHTYTSLTLARTMQQKRKADAKFSKKWKISGDIRTRYYE